MVPAAEEQMPKRLLFQKSVGKWKWEDQKIGITEGNLKAC
jgi:hypothetical protein